MRALFFGIVFLCFSLIPVRPYALTAEQILHLKEKGVEDRTIQMLLERERQEKENTPALGVREQPRPDGGKDKIYFSVTDRQEEIDRRREEKEKLDRALEILRNLIIDQGRR
jgi:DNA-binding transcriptional MerR regulator